MGAVSPNPAVGAVVVLEGQDPVPWSAFHSRLELHVWTTPASFEGYSLHRVTNLKTARIHFKIAGEVQLVVLLDTYAVLDNRSNNYYTNFARKNLPAP